MHIKCTVPICQKIKQDTENFYFLLEVAREWITVDSKECSIAPDASRISKTAAYNDTPFRLSGQLRDHVLEKIFTGRRTNLD